jgi:hypothetical protein
VLPRSAVELVDTYDGPGTPNACRDDGAEPNEGAVPAPLLPPVPIVVTREEPPAAMPPAAYAAGPEGVAGRMGVVVPDAPAAPRLVGLRTVDIVMEVLSRLSRGELPLPPPPPPLAPSRAESTASPSSEMSSLATRARPVNARLTGAC